MPGRRSQPVMRPTLGGRIISMQDACLLTGSSVATLRVWLKHKTFEELLDYIENGKPKAIRGTPRRVLFNGKPCSKEELAEALGLTHEEARGIMKRFKTRIPANITKEHLELERSLREDSDWVPRVEFNPDDHQSLKDLEE